MNSSSRASRAATPPRGAAGEAADRSRKLAQFALAVLASLWAGEDLDGADIQHLGLLHGLIEHTAFDPSKHSDSLGIGAEPGDEWFEEQPWLRALASPSNRKDGSSPKTTSTQGRGGQ